MSNNRTKPLPNTDGLMVLPIWIRLNLPRASPSETKSKRLPRWRKKSGSGSRTDRMWVEFLHVIVVGYIGVASSNIGRAWMLRHTGYVPLFIVLVAGTIGLLIGGHLATAIGVAFCTAFPGACETVSATDSVRRELDFAGGLLCALAVACWFNRKYPRSQAYKKVCEIGSHLIEVLLQEAVEDQFLVELTMENGKVYIGHPVGSGIFAPGQGDVTIVPFVSGYRDKKTRTFRLTTFYVDALERFTQGTDAQIRMTDFHVVLPKRQINSARRFDLEVYRESFARPSNAVE